MHNKLVFCFTNCITTIIFGCVILIPVHRNSLVLWNITQQSAARFTVFIHPFCLIPIISGRGWGLSHCAGLFLKIKQAF